MRGPARIAPAAPSTARPATSTRRAWAASDTAAWSLLSVRTAVAQMTGTVDLGVSTVHYDGFLPSGAAAVTPVLRWDRPAGMLTASGTYLRLEVGDTTYTDLESSAHAGRGPVALEAKLGARVWSRGGGRGVYGEGSATIWVGGRTAFVISGGRYATDPISGSITGRYLSAALRVRTAAPRRAFPRDPAVLHARGADGATVLRAARLEVHADRNRAVRLVVRVASAALVEIAGDFTDWQPVAMGSASPDTWEITLPVPSG